MLKFNIRGENVEVTDAIRDYVVKRFSKLERFLEPNVEANAHVPITAALPAGLTLAIPMLEPVTSTEDLPPWMR